MSDALSAIFFILGPVYLTCGVVLAWSTFSHSDRLSQILKLSAIVWSVVLTLALAAMGLIGLLCHGNWLYGHLECRGIGDGFADTISGISILCFALGMIYGVVLLVAGGTWEAIARNRT